MTDKKINMEENKDFINFLDNYLEQINQQIKATSNSVRRISHLVKKINQEKRKIEYQNVPGVEGWFDGFSLIGDGGKKYEVNPNYSAKSRLLYGDKLKLIEEEGGKQVFKQIEKKEPKEIEGTLSKKEGKWYLLCDNGTYRLSDVAADYQGAQLNIKAIAEIPDDNEKAPFAALKEIKRAIGEKDIKAKKIKNTSTGSRPTENKKSSVKKAKKPKKAPSASPGSKKEKKIDLKKTNNKPMALEDDDLR